MRDDAYRLVERVPTVEEYLALRAAVGWGRRDPEMTARGLANALYTVCLAYQGEIIACGRITGDGGLYYELHDIIVVPAHQGRGVGTRLVLALLAYLRANAGPDAFVSLMAAKGASAFYRRFGFAERPADQPGMYLARGP